MDELGENVTIRCADSSMLPSDDELTSQVDLLVEETQTEEDPTEETLGMKTPLASGQDPLRTLSPFPSLPTTSSLWDPFHESSRETETRRTPSLPNIWDTSCSTKESRDSSPPSDK
jgi:hypothetical protein